MKKIKGWVLIVDGKVEMVIARPELPSDILLKFLGGEYIEATIHYELPPKPRTKAKRTATKETGITS